MGTPTMKVRYAYVHEDVDRHGNVRVYFWRKGQRKVRMREAPGSPEFAETYKRLLGRSEAGELATPDAGRSDTLRWLCTQYFASAEFRRLDPQTQRTRQGILEHILAERWLQGRERPFLASQWAVSVQRPLVCFATVRPNFQGQLIIASRPCADCLPGPKNRSL